MAASIKMLEHYFDEYEKPAVVSTVKSNTLKPAQVQNYFLRKCFTGISIDNILFASLVKTELFFFIRKRGDDK